MKLSLILLRFTVRKLELSLISLGLPATTIVHWLYYEVGEGKNASDWLGAIIKLAYLRSVAKNRERSVRTIPEIMESTKDNMGEAFKKVAFIELQEVDKFERPSKEEAKAEGIPVPGIQKLHHLSLAPDGSIFGRPLACRQCLTLHVRCLLLLLLLLHQTTLFLRRPCVMPALP